MDVILSKDRVDVQECDVLVIGFFNGRETSDGIQWLDRLEAQRNALTVFNGEEVDR